MSDGLAFVVGILVLMVGVVWLAVLLECVTQMLDKGAAPPHRWVAVAAFWSLAGMPLLLLRAL